MARIRSPAHAPAMDPAWQRCRWQRGRDFALEPKLTALVMRIFGAKRRYEKLMRSSLETCTMLDVQKRYNKLMIHFDGQGDGLGLIIKETTGQIRSYHRQADDLIKYYLVLQRTSNLILRSKNADILAWIERSCSRSIQARISRISAEGAPVGKKSEGATPVSKNDHSRHA